MGPNSWWSYASPLSTGKTIMLIRKTPVRALVAIAAFAALATPLAGFAQQGPWLVRARAVNLDSANKDSTGLGLSINDKVIPEVDISYFFSPNISAELVLTYPQKQDLRAGGTQIGTLKHLPPTLTVQYRFTGLGAFTPYVGAGINYTRFSSVKLPAGVGIDKNSVGAAVQVGADFQLSPQLSLNVDLKKVQIRTDVSAGGARAGEFRIDPLLFGVGLGWRF
jgi:outer membrane protein